MISFLVYSFTIFTVLLPLRDLLLVLILLFFIFLQSPVRMPQIPLWGNNIPHQ